ncbi:uncharacterized protein LOC126967831 [Leptidea sinapis]|uniref:uncharacterized protein LOC126967831 n=1 Tax=Leptidea sinapis TaxID=189913 RepID=UPI0021C47A0D|nr:uncharacterized protein LOC126967831 [Leptidea sinapis]
MSEEEYEEVSSRTKKTKSVLSTPLRLIIIEPRGRYCRAVWCAIGLGVVQLTLGATNMAVLIYTLKTKDMHAILCMVAYHFFAAQAILSLNYANGWSTPMRLRHRRLAHVLLQMCGMAAAITGTVLITISKGFSTSPHGITGVVTAVLALISLILGPLALFGGRYLKIIHASFGIPTFIMSSICLCLGLFTSRFQDWASSTAVYILTVFVIFYTCFIMIASFIKCTMRMLSVIGVLSCAASSLSERHLFPKR